MQIKYPTLIALQLLLVLGLLFVWGTSSSAGGAKLASTLSCEEINEYLEDQLEEEALEDGVVLARGFVVLEMDTACFTQFLRIVDLSNPVHSSGWMMPLRI